MIQLSMIQERTHPELAGLIATVKHALGGRFSDPFKLLLHTPDVALAWLGLIEAIRSKTELDGQIRELVIIRVATINRVNYIKKTHESIYGPKEGLTNEQVAAISNWPDSSLFSECQRAVLAYTDAMTNDIHVPDEVQQELPSHFSERQIIELTILIGIYNMCSRVFEAFEIENRAALL